MSKTLYISDLDGTLLSSNQTLSQYTTDVINSLTNKNILFSYATARGYATASKVTSALNPRIPAIVQNGTFTVETGSGKKLMSNTFSEDDSKYIYSVLTSSGIQPTVYSLINEVERFTYLKNNLSRGMKLFLDSRKGDKRENAIENGSPLCGEVYYFACIDEPEKLQKAYDILKNKCLCICSEDLYFENVHWLEIMPKGAGKANAVKELQKMLGCDRLVCFGDGKNDISMFEIADECYAVENADEELKKIATAIIDSNDNDGVAKWLINNIREDFLC